MASATDLAPELIQNVSSTLDFSSILAQRHTNRQLAEYSATALTQCSEITVTCSKAGLGRLKELTTIIDGHDKDMKQKVVANIEHVTIHTLTGAVPVSLYLYAEDARFWS
jgi:flavorubredoxin